MRPKRDQPTERDEVEVTPEMAAAGAKVLLKVRSLNYESAEEAVEEIFTAMERARSLRASQQMPPCA